MLVILGENAIKTRDDLADLAGDELLELVPAEGLTLDAANTIIMAARAHWFEDEETAEGVNEEAVEEAGAAATESAADAAAEEPAEKT